MAGKRAGTGDWTGARRRRADPTVSSVSRDDRIDSDRVDHQERSVGRLARWVLAVLVTPPVTSQSPPFEPEVDEA